MGGGRGCGCRARTTGTVARYLAHVPFGHRPTRLLVRVRRWVCDGCGRRWRDDTRRAAAPRARLSRGAVAWALAALVVDHMSVARIAASLAVSWRTANRAVLQAGDATLVKAPGRLDGVEMIGVDEHVWRHTRKGDRYVTVVIDLTPVMRQQGPARLVDMVPGRSKAALSDWLAKQDRAWARRVRLVAMDGFTGYKTAASAVLPQARVVMDPFHVAALAGQALDECRRRLQRQTTGRRGRASDPLYKARRTLRTGADWLTDKQWGRLEELFTNPDLAPLEATWGVYQRVVAAYRTGDPGLGRAVMSDLIDSITGRIPDGLDEISRLGRTVLRRRADILAAFETTHTSNGPTEAINGRLEHLRGTALGFRNLDNYRLRSLLEAGGFRPILQPHLHP